MQASIRRDPAGTHLAFTGDLTEDFDFSPLLPDLEGALEIDLAGLRRINSAGVRQWIRFMGALGEGRQVVLARCPTSFIRQAGMIRNFLGHAAVQSLYAPYLCPGCEAARSVLLEAAALAGRSFPEIRCDGCAEAMEVDVVPEAFLGFLDD